MSAQATLPSKLSHSETPSTAPSRVRSKESISLALLGLAVYLGAAIYLVFGLHYYAGDAVSRVANAYYVLFSRHPHLGAIGFIWNPLPSLFELPFVALHPIFPAMVTKGLAGSVVSAVLGASAVYNMNYLLRGFIPHTLTRIIITLTFAFNPLIVLYGANGMSDLMWVACILGTYSGVIDYVHTRSLRRLVVGGLWLAIGLGMRYEAIPFGAMLIGALVLGQWKKTTPAQSQGSAIVFATPVVVAGGLWIYLNWLIMKDPLYFLNSSYGNLAQTSTGAYMTHAMVQADHHVLGALLYVVRFGLLYWPLYLGFAIALWYSFGKRRDPRALVLIAGTIGAELLELVLAYEGHLGEWDRYFLEYIPNGVLLLAFSAHKIIYKSFSRHSRIKRSLVSLSLSLLFLSGSVGTIIALQHPVLGQSDGSAIDMAWHQQSMKLSSDPFTVDEPVIAYVDAHPHLSILADTFKDWPIVVRSHHLNQFVITSDYDFASILHNPRGRVDAILVPKPTGVAKLDAVNRAFPGMWAGHVSWVKLIKQFPAGPDYRLYAVLSTAP